MKEIMKGIVKEKPEIGAVYRNDLPVPKVKDNEILVEVKATAICGTDMHIYNWEKYAQDRLKLPMVFGHEFAGDIVKVGSMVKNFKVGDRVAGETHIPCNTCYQCQTGNKHICENMKIIGVHTPGSFAEYISIPEDCAWKLDDILSYETGSILEPMGVAVHGVLSGEIGGKTVAIYGCGPIGLMAVGAAAACGASQVFAIDVFEEKLEAAKKMGANIVLKSGQDDVVKTVLDTTCGRGVDVVLDYSGNSKAIQEGFKILQKGGRFTMVGLPNDPVALDLSESIIYKEAHVNGSTGRLMYKTWWQCSELLKSGKLDIKPVIGGVYPLEDFEKAFEALKNGAPGKMILIP
ncbi:MAG TPA: L-threonine 3-dehydrogenase [Tepidanaerobacter syntrophicus]|uniref:L-threonine 3-dehydrogenase n=1 Tax=Tepidanaerobacter syntrophicus TaxID=224999 RepID=UPI0017756038|nr:L-threonine 3-dehydrogenase [Tepidanaerobacter syntrophicus]HHV83337.1 L-threonine 3-dehydrogenase [Tepidanaerobacter syntrophicus]